MWHERCHSVASAASPSASLPCGPEPCGPEPCGSPSWRWSSGLRSCGLRSCGSPSWRWSSGLRSCGPEPCGSPSWRRSCGPEPFGSPSWRRSCGLRSCGPEPCGPPSSRWSSWPPSYAAGALFTAFFAVDLRAAVFLAGALRTALLAAAFFTAIATPSLGFNACLNAEPVANRTPFDAGIGTTAPVLGFRPTRGPRAVGVNAPKPITVTFRPDRTSVTIVPNNSSTTSSTIRRDDDVDALTVLTSCDLFKNHLLSDT